MEFYSLVSRHFKVLFLLKNGFVKTAQKKDFFVKTTKPIPQPLS
jgi:hypothetical protein